MPDAKCELPFAVGGASQHNPDAVTESQNSQDSSAILIGERIIVGVVADGCTGTHPALEGSTHSSNEVGAKLTAYLVARAAMRFASMSVELPAEEFVHRVSTTATRKLSTILRTLAGRGRGNRELFAYDFLMTTVLGFAVTRTRFLVFHSGDGVIGINGKNHILDSESGKYLAQDIAPSTAQRTNGIERALRLFAQGSSRDLHSIFLATDGLARLVRDHPLEVAGFTDARPSEQQVQNDFDFLLQEFRGKLAWSPHVNLNLEDDATFVLIRRVDGRHSE